MSQQLASIEKQITETAARRKISYDARVTQICCGPTENGCDARVTQICCGPTENGCDARVTQICCGPTENGCDARVTQICCGPTENGCDAIIGKPGAMVSARKFKGSLQQVLNLMPVKSG